MAVQLSDAQKFRYTVSLNSVPSPVEENLVKTGYECIIRGRKRDVVFFYLSR
jgi:hypothetical protein